MKFRLLLGSIALAISTNLGAIPVFDIANYAQNIKVVINQGNQIRNQIQQYKSQIDHYNNLLTNTKSLTAFQWDNANQVINNLMEATNTIDYYKQEAGGLQSYLDRFQSSEYYSKAACFTGNCSKAELDKIKQNQLQSSVAQKRANDAMLKGIDKQQKSLKSDADKLRELQQKAESAEGQKQALQAASQLASNQSHQLLQIRGLLMAQQNAQATRDAAASNKEAIKEAGDERFRQGTFRKSSGRKW